MGLGGEFFCEVCRSSKALREDREGTKDQGSDLRHLRSAGNGNGNCASCIDLFVDLLDKLGPVPKISLILHTNGGSTLAAWRLVNLVRTFCDELEVLIPLKPLSAGTLISIGADVVVMTKQAALGPIDPSVNNPLNPQVNLGNQLVRVPVSVESVRGYWMRRARILEFGDRLQ